MRLIGRLFGQETCLFYLFVGLGRLRFKFSRSLKGDMHSHYIRRHDVEVDAKVHSGAFLCKIGACWNLYDLINCIYATPLSFLTLSHVAPSFSIFSTTSTAYLKFCDPANALTMTVSFLSETSLPIALAMNAPKWSSGHD